MARLRLPAVTVAAVALLLVRADHVVGQPVEDCLVPRVTLPVPVAPTCRELVEGLVPTSTTVPPPDVPAPPPVPAGTGCFAVDPGTPECSFTATGWIEVDVFAVIGYVEILDEHGEQAGGFAGAGYDPPQLFGVVLPAVPGNQVVVRADAGWVAARNRTPATR
jgi:hypothetical protein